MRANSTLKERYRAILSSTGLIFILTGGLMLLPLTAVALRPSEWVHALGFVVPALILAGLGGSMWRAFRPKTSATLTVQEGGVIVLISWVGVCLFSAWPFLVIQKLNFTQAVFESVSGWTTTGLSVVDVTTAPHVILLWRSLMQLAGGAGLAVIMLAAIAGPVGPSLAAAEGRSEQLVPQVRESVKLVMVLYAGYAVVGILAYWTAGMDFFDAVNHAFAAISTGGFSTRAESIGHWNSVAIEVVSIPLMVMGNLNFITAYLLLHGKARVATRSGEVRMVAGLAPACALILFMLVCRGLYPTLGKGIRVAVFETVTALTTTGFSTVSYGPWPSFGFLILLVLMLIGGGTCSTAGGIKQYRVYLLLKSLQWELRRPLLPRTAVVENYIWQGEHKDFIGADRIRQAANFLFLYLATYVVGAAVLTAHGVSLKDSLFEFASALGTVGLSVGVTSANSPPAVLWTETLGMFLGRLEFFVILLGIRKIASDSVLLMRRKNLG